MVAEADEVVELSVSGETSGFCVTRSLLCSVPGSKLDTLFSGRHNLPKINGKIFIDRNPQIFAMTLDYLRNDMKLPKNLDKLTLEKVNMELEYWDLLIKHEQP